MVGNGQVQSPDKGKVWLIIGGTIDHVTGTGTALDIRKKDETTGVTQRLAHLYAGAETRNGYPLFKNTSNATGVVLTTFEEFSQYCLPLVSDERQIVFNGAAAALAQIDVLEFDA
jgi:hypothetical protein